MSERPDQWTRMSVEGAALTITVRVQDHHADLVFAGDDLDDLGRAVAAAKSNRPSGLPESFTVKERQALAFLACGLSNKLIADRMRVSYHTAKFHVANVMKKLGADTRAGAVAKAAALGFVGRRDGLWSL